MLGDKRFGLTFNLLAIKVLPSLIPILVTPNLKLEEVGYSLFIFLLLLLLFLIYLLAYLSF